MPNMQALREKIIRLAKQGYDEFAIAAATNTNVALVLDIAPGCKRRHPWLITRLRLDGQPFAWARKEVKALRTGL
jgi:hypothetical protein